jgi:hypothetical protein
MAQIRPIAERDEFAACDRCLTTMERVMSLPAKRTDGIYSYAPNIGTEEAFERKEAKIKKREEGRG